MNREFENGVRVYSILSLSLASTGSLVISIYSVSFKTFRPISTIGGNCVDFCPTKTSVSGKLVNMKAKAVDLFQCSIWTRSVLLLQALGKSNKIDFARVNEGGRIGEWKEGSQACTYTPRLFINGCESL